MIKINLLGKKKVAQGGVPFGLDEHIAKLGLNVDEFQEMRPGLVRLAVLLVGLYIGNYVPTYLHEEKVRELDAQIGVLVQKESALQKEKAAQKDIRNQMEQLAKEEIELQRQVNAVNALQRDRNLVFRTVDNIISSIPQKVWVDQIRFSKDLKVTISGASWEYFPINDFVKAINETTHFSNVLFRGISAQSAKSLIKGLPESIQKIKTFEIDFDVKGSGSS